MLTQFLFGKHPESSLAPPGRYGGEVKLVFLVLLLVSIFTERFGWEAVEREAKIVFRLPVDLK